MMRTHKQNDNPLEMEYLDVELNISGTSFATPIAFSIGNKVLKLAWQGYSSKEIAVQLGLDLRTVITYRAKLIRSANDRTQRIASQATNQRVGPTSRMDSARPPINAEYLLYLLLRRDERNAVIGDLVECYGQMVRRFDKRRADIWFYKQVGGSLLPLLREALLRIGAFVWLGRVLRRLIS